MVSLGCTQGFSRSARTKIPAAQAMQMLPQGQVLLLPAAVEGQETSAGLAELPGTGRMRLVGGSLATRAFPGG